MTAEVKDHPVPEEAAASLTDKGHRDKKPMK